MTTLRFLLAVWALAGCERPSASHSSAARQDPAAPAEPRATIAPEILETPLSTGGTYRYVRFRFALDETRIGAVDLAFDRTLDEVLEESGAALSINGGFWSVEREPEGLTVAGQTRIGELDRELGGGVLVVERGLARLLDAEDGPPALPDAPELAVQCRPRLVVDGAVSVRETGRVADRTALCIRDGGRTLDVIIARTDDLVGHGGPSLYAFAERLVADGCEQALNLDGGSSTGAAWRERSGLRSMPARAQLRTALLFHVPVE